MGLNNIKRMRKDSGFTIVELLIVIVVIGILATITIVAYNGVQQKAKTNVNLTNAAQAQKVAEAFNADNSRYPGLTTDFRTGTTASLPTSIIVSPAAITATTNTVSWQYVGASATTATGGRLTYWDFGTNLASTNIIYVGSAVVGSTFVTPAS